VDNADPRLVAGCRQLVADLFILGDVQPNVETIAADYVAQISGQESETGVVDASQSSTYFNAGPLKAAHALVSAMVSLEFMLKTAGYDRFVDLALTTMLKARLSPPADVLRKLAPGIDPHRR
jgi:hypothetical protein